MKKLATDEHQMDRLFSIVRDALDRYTMLMVRNSRMLRFLDYCNTFTLILSNFFIFRRLRQLWRSGVSVPEMPTVSCRTLLLFKFSLSRVRLMFPPLHSINYDGLDAFLCVECGYCTSGGFSYELTAGLALSAIAIMDEDG